MIFNMKLATSDEIKRIDSLSTEKYGISSQVRMEIAGIKTYEIIKNKYQPKKTLLILGTGNNGGDGLVVARYLSINKYECDIVIVTTSKKQSSDFKKNFSIVKKLKIPIKKDFKNINLKNYDLIIDGIFGVGLNRVIHEKIQKIIKKLNKSMIPICSIDIPSGLNPNNGKTYSCSIVADTTITYDLVKPGLVTDPGLKFSKEIFLVDLPTPFDLKKDIYSHFVNSDFFLNFFRQRSKSSNKGTFGHILIIGGSKNMSGAVLLAGLAAYKSGSGLVSLCVPKCISKNVKNKIPESIIIEVPNSRDSATINEEQFLGSIEKNIRKQPNCVVIGPGLGNRSHLIKIIKDSLGFFKCPIILDADALNLISTDPSLIKKYSHNIIITPHPGEMSKITNKSVKFVQENRIQVAKNISKETGSITVLKGFRTVITDKLGKLFINSSGNEGMATGGMGDALTGIIASFIGQGYSSLNSSILGVFVHGKAGDKIALKNSKRGILATEIIRELPKTILDLENYSHPSKELEKINNEQ